jgi:plastocyanin
VSVSSPGRWRTSLLPAAVLLTVSLTVLAACGSSGPKSAAASTAPAVTSTSAPATPGATMPGMTMPGTTTTAAGAAGANQAPVSGSAVAIKNFAFSPASLTVSVGTTVTWTNQDSDAHTVTGKAGTPDSPTLNTGDTFKYTFTKAGTYSYLCTIHPFMLGTVVVTP